MKKIFLLTALAVLLGVATATAQRIAVVSENGETNVFTTLQAAIEGAAPGSVIYLPGGGFPLPDNVKITKKLTIIGIGHKLTNDNVDGITIISGNLFFNEGSGGSAVIGCYITGVVSIGEDAAVSNILVRYCNLLNVEVKNNLCLSTTINQNYIRRRSLFANSDVYISNNISDKLFNIGSGVIKNNVIMDRDGYYYAFADPGHAFDHVDNTTIINNVILMTRVHRGNNCQSNNNLVVGGSWGQEPIVIDATAEDIFINDSGVSTTSNYHFEDPYKQYENQVGVYADGVNFDKQMAPVPYIVAKRIAEETDAAGQLKIQVRVKAGE